MSKKIIAIVTLALFVPSLVFAAVTFEDNTTLSLNGTAATVWAMGAVTLGTGSADSEADYVILNAGGVTPELRVVAVPNNEAFHVGVGDVVPVTLLEVSPSGSTLSFTIDTSDITAKTGGYYLSSWKGTAGAAETISMRIQAEQASTTYWLVVDGSNDTTNDSNSSGIVSFSYNAVNTSEHTFTLTEYVGGGGGGGGGGSTITAANVNAPNGGESWAGGSSQNITWLATGSGISKIKLSYSLDGGSSYPYVIASSESNDGSYTWTVPNISSSSVKVKVEALTSTNSVLVSDISNANFAITAVVPSISTTLSTIVASPTSVVANGTSTSTITVTAKDDTGALLSGKTVVLTSSRGTSDTITPATATTDASGVATFTVLSSMAGTSTYTASVDGNTLSGTATVSFTAESSSDSDTGEDADTAPTETPISLSVGDRIKSSLSTSVYFYGSDNKRHLFPNEKTYKSWYTDWTGVKIVPVSQLQGISLGHNVTIRPGTVLLKIETDPKVYAVEPTGLLRWVPTEARALALYGSNWNTQIIDVPLIYWVDYTFGADLTTDQHPTGTLVQYTGTTEVYYVQGSEKRHFTGAAFEANKYQTKYIETIPETISYTNGTDIAGIETALVNIY